MSADPHQHVCAACAQDLPREQFPSKPVNSKCTHEMETCSQCWRQWLQVQVATKTFDRIQCAQCTCLLTQSEVKALASEEIYQRCVYIKALSPVRIVTFAYRYLDSELRATLSSDPNFYWCMSGSCSYGQLHFDGDIFTCQACGHKACMTCKAPWHGGETCYDYQARVQEEHDGPQRFGMLGIGEDIRGENEKKSLRERQQTEETEAAETLSRVSKLCPGCVRKVQKNGYVFVRNSH